MASLTITLNQFRDNVVATHTGVEWAGGFISRTAAYSASSVFNLCRVPDGAVLLDFVLRINLASADQTFEIGTSQTPSGILQLSTLTATYSLSVGTGEEINVVRSVIRGYSHTGFGLAGGDAGMLLPAKISLSDSLQPQTAWIQGRPTNAGSASAIMQFICFYSMAGDRGFGTIR